MDRLRELLSRRRRRMRDAGLPVVQCALAAGVAFLLARDVVGHALPFFAPIACVLVLGISLTNRLLRAELTSGEPTDGARSAVIDTAARLPRAGGGYSAEVVLAQVRSMLIDLLQATGMGRDEALEAAERARTTEA